MRQVSRRQFVAATGITLGSSGFAGCASLNPFASSGESEETEAEPGPFRKVSVDGYSLVIAFDPNITEAAGENESGGSGNETGPGTEGEEAANVSDVNQVLLEDSAGEQVESGTLGTNQVIDFPLLTFEDNGVSIKDALDLGRYTIIAVGSGGSYENEVTLEPDLSISNVAFPNELENVSTPESPLSYANPIIEVENAGTAPAILIESSFGGVPNEREEVDYQDEQSERESGSRLSQFADAKRASQSVLELARTPVPVAPSTRIQTGFSPFAIPQKLYEPGGDKGGGVENLRSNYANETVEGDLTIQTREGTNYQISVEVNLSGGVSQVNSPGTTPYYVFRNPTVKDWGSEIAN